MPQAKEWIGALLLLGTIIGTISANRPAAAVPDQPIRPSIACPDRLEDLMPLLLRDLPSYTNRVTQQSYQLDQNANTPGHVVLAGEPNYEPLTLNPGEKLPTAESETPQVFFTTLERQYVAGKLVRLQHHHWLFITPTETRGWRLVMIYSAIGIYPSAQPATAQLSNQSNPLSSPPEDTSQGAIAQAIRLWLRDCEAGSIVGQE
jgi:hypothetical protein